MNYLSKYNIVYHWPHWRNKLSWHGSHNSFLSPTIHTQSILHHVHKCVCILVHQILHMERSKCQSLRLPTYMTLRGECRIFLTTKTIHLLNFWQILWRFIFWYQSHLLPFSLPLYTVSCIFGILPVAGTDNLSAVKRNYYTDHQSKE